ncbi:unnamed protein product [Darwinula stevensoni]|uniref:Amine oxidase domain-containing protein n=1 Tax=Darwinula stevensoni TaxID=69355 RepID=A0A7R8XC50_9CRUS|nr:unnamed protein product [Darwinula stevensoni]CAG0891658.1 unnamed protein product [Darwinula stevensoni]
MSSPPRVVIVGAGLAGLAAARRLVQCGFSDVTVLEGGSSHAELRDLLDVPQFDPFDEAHIRARRVGGRVYTRKFGDQNAVVELGASFVHGASPANPIYQLANVSRILSGGRRRANEREASGLVYARAASPIPAAVSQKAAGIFRRVEREAAGLAAMPSDPTKNLEDFFMERLDAGRSFADQKLASQAECVFNCFKNAIALETGDELRLVSAQGYGCYEELPGGDLVAPGGFGKILTRLRNSIPDGRVKLGHHVVTIDWTEKNENVTVTCSNGETFEADHVIVTVSLGVLKNSPNLFEPRLPDRKLRSIANIGFGRVNKIFLEFDPPFWAPGEGRLRLGWTDEEYRTRTEKDWTRYVYAFEEATGDARVLVAWICGSGAEAIEGLPPEDVAVGCTQLLREFTGNPLLEPPRQVLRTKWVSSPRFRGSYSFVSTGSGREDVEALAEPLRGGRGPRLHFAGEATHPVYFSTMHGALLSGVREADAIRWEYVGAGSFGG